VLLDRAIGPLYEAVIEATEEAILNALCAADDMTGRDDHFAPGLPLDKVQAILARYRPAAAHPGGAEVVPDAPPPKPAPAAKSNEAGS
jgi:D-aminopeptidase